MYKTPSKTPDRSPNSSTPGRPKETGSRQQTHPDQTSQSGSVATDKEVTARTKAKPPNLGKLDRRQ